MRYIFESRCQSYLNRIYLIQHHPKILLFIFLSRNISKNIIFYTIHCVARGNGFLLPLHVILSKHSIFKLFRVTLFQKHYFSGQDQTYLRQKRGLCADTPFNQLVFKNFYSVNTHHHFKHHILYL